MKIQQPLFSQFIAITTGLPNYPERVRDTYLEPQYAITQGLVCINWEISFLTTTDSVTYSISR